MIRTLYFACHLPKAPADALNAESGRIYSQVLVEQYRIYRREGVWLPAGTQERYNDTLNRETPRLLQAHSIDAAQQGFHKASREVVTWAVERQIGTLANGDVRDAGDGKRLRSKSQQKVSGWSHGRMCNYIGYKAKVAGIAVEDKVDEAHTSQTCACCGSRHKPRGRVYTCPTCGSTVHRDVQGAANILSRFLYDDLAKVPVPTLKYRYPALRGKRSSPGHGACCS
jgi:IS605 OrfB family transposase